MPANDGDCAAPKIAPILTYAHADGRCSIAGGYRIRDGSQFYAGRYFYGDSCTSELFVAQESSGTWSSVQWSVDTGALPIYGLVSFGEAEDGQLYVVDHGAAVAAAGRILIVEAPLFIDSFE